MLERATRFGNLVFDRDAIVRAALRAYVESVLQNIARFSFPACAVPEWTGDLKRGAFMNRDGCGGYEVVAWTEAGVVGLAYELGWGPIEQLGLSVDAVTGGPDDVRGALPGLPDELEPALVMATAMLDTGDALRKKGDGYVAYGEKLAGVGFWLHGDRVDGMLFDDPTACGADRLAAWGLLQGGRLLPPIYFGRPYDRAVMLEHARKDAPVHAVIDAVVDRALRGPTEFMPAELEMLFHPAPNPERLLRVRRRLQEVGITWPGSPELPPEVEEPWPRINPFTGQPMVKANRPTK